MSEMTETGLTVNQGEQWLQSLSNLDLPTLTELKSLSSSVLMLQANTGKMAVETGQALKRIKEVLCAENPELWEHWIGHFAFSKDYANRMIKVAERVAESPMLQREINNLSFRHLREIDRFARGEGNEEAMVQAIIGSNLSVDETRFLVTQGNKGKIDVAELVKDNPDLKPVVEQLQKQFREDAAAESRSKTTELKERIRDLQDSTEQLRQEQSEKDEQMDKLVNALHVEKAAEEVGEGDVEKGKLLIELEQTKQKLANTEAALEQVSGDFSRVQTNYEQWRHSPTGVAKMEYRKTVDEITKFFSTTMTPAAIVAKIKGLDSQEAVDEMIAMVDLVQHWAADVRAQLTPATEVA